MPVDTGKYFEHTHDDTMKSVYYTFTPKPLMNGNFYSVDGELLSLLVDAHRALGILEGMVTDMPDSDRLYMLALFKESYYSQQIDYPGIDLYSALETRGCGEGPDAVQNIMGEYKKAFAAQTRIDQAADICTTALYGTAANGKMDIRINPMFLTNTITNLRQYSPTAPAQIMPALNDMFLYLEQDSSDSLIKAALAHYQFEMIHPFECHNGITGRVLLHKAMLDMGLQAASYLCISELLYESLNDYFDLLSATQKGGGYIRWIKYFIGIIYEAARRRINQVKSYRQIVERDKEKIWQLDPQRIHNVMAVFDHWKCYLISNVKHPVKVLAVSHSVVERAIHILVELDILQQITATPRYRKYMYSELAELYVGQQFKAIRN